ncbi:MAG: hypothetical protein ACNS61_02590 [Candidatus Wenzhouxiangella sp. M2_3B_020]
MPLLEGVSVAGLAAAIALPWLAGALGVRLAAGPGSRWTAAAGFGFFAGQLLVIVLLLAWDALGIALAFWPPALLVAALAGVLGWRVSGHGVQRPVLPRWHWTTWLALAVLLALIVARFWLMAQELALRPLFPWDAWMNWVPKAIVWFHHLELTPFVAPSDWLAAPAGEEVYTLGNRRASEYPAGVPLLLLWTMLGGGTADHTLVYLPWLLAPVAFALLLWDRLRAGGTGPVIALLAVYLFASQPLVNVHTMLAGYADLWLALYLSTGIIAADAFHRSRSTAAAGLAVTMAVGCMLMKTPGMVFGAVVVAMVVLVALGLPGRWWRRATLAGLAGIALLLALGLVPGLLGTAGEDWTLPLPGTLPELRLQPRPLAPLLAESLYVFANWHLLWVALPLAGIAAFVLRGRTSLDRPAIAGLVAAAGLLVFVFGFTHYFRQAENLLTLNRTILYLVPLVAYVAGTWLNDARRAADADD